MKKREKILKAISESELERLTIEDIRGIMKDRYRHIPSNNELGQLLRTIDDLEVVDKTKAVSITRHTYDTNVYRIKEDSHEE